MPAGGLSREEFEAERALLRGVAYRILGTGRDADEAVQEAWLRLNEGGEENISNRRAWLTKVVARISFDMLRRRRTRNEEPLGPEHAELPQPNDTDNPESSAMLADSVSLALLTVLDRLEPHERLAFVLHDIFGVSFEEIAPIIDRSPAAARQVASRARKRVQGEPAVDGRERHRRKELIENFRAAAHQGDLQRLISLLDPDAELRVDPQMLPDGAPTLIRGAARVAKQALLGKGRRAQLAIVDGDIGIIAGADNRLGLAFTFDVGTKIKGIELIASPVRLRALEISLLDDRDLKISTGFPGS
jgi:RNA polymerase sigma factor (sigma-70 family)